MENALDESVALRMGLAAKALPEIGVQKLVNFLANQLNLPITEKKLRSLSPGSLFKDLQALDSRLERSHVNQAFAILTSVDVNAMDAPEVSVTEKLAGPKVRVAISSNNQENIDGHFNSCLRFLIYDVNETQYQLVDVRAVETTERGSSRPEAIIESIKDCQLLATLSIGGPAAARVIRSDIHPMKVEPNTTAGAFLEPLQAVIGNPPPWLGKKLISD